MESKKLSFNIKLILRDTLRHWPIWAIPMVLYLLSVTGFQGLFSYQDTEKFIENVLEQLSGTSEFFSIVFGLVAAYAAFGFQGSKKKTSFYEVLPMNRLSLFINRFLFGYLLLFIPNLFIFIVENTQAVVICGGSRFLSLLCWLLVNAAQNLFWFSLGILFMVICGRILMAGVCYLAFSILGLVLEYSFAVYSIFMYLGFSSIVSPADVADLGIISPLEYLFDSGILRYESPFGIDGSYGATKLATTFIAFAVLIVIAYILYSKRKSERTGDNIVFPFMKTVISCCFAFVFSLDLTMFIVGILLYNKTGMAHSAGGRICIAVMLGIFGFIGYIIATMIIEKKFKVFKKFSFKAAVFALVLVIFSVLYMHDIFGLEKRVPDTYDVEYCRIISDEFSNDNNYFRSVEGKKMSEENKEVIIGLHKLIMENFDELIRDDSKYNEWENRISFEYYMKNDKNIYREYYINPDGELHKKISAYVERYPNYFN